MFCSPPGDLKLGVARGVSLLDPVPVFEEHPAFGVDKHRAERLVAVLQGSAGKLHAAAQLVQFDSGGRIERGHSPYASKVTAHRDSARPPHLRWAPIALVAVGGAFGAATREGLSLLIPNLGEVPVSIAIINVAGAFLLGCLYEALTRLDSARSAGVNLKLLLGTGYCGGFTTYSALATDTAMFLRDGLPWAAVAYPAGTVLIGAFATWLGIAVAAGTNSRLQAKAAGPSDEDHPACDREAGS